MSSSRLAAAPTEHMSTAEKKTWNTNSHKMFRDVFHVILGLRKGNVHAQDGKWSSAVTNVVAISPPPHCAKVNQNTATNARSKFWWCHLQMPYLTTPRTQTGSDITHYYKNQVSSVYLTLRQKSWMASLWWPACQSWTGSSCLPISAAEHAGRFMLLIQPIHFCTYLLRHLLTCLQVVVFLQFLFFFSTCVAVATDLLVSVPARPTGRQHE